MKRIFALVLSFVFLLSCLVLPAGAMFDPSPVYQVQAASAYIVNTDTNIIVYDKDSTKQVSAGGLTKYMTLAVLLTNYADQLDSTFQMPFAISDYVYNTNNADMRSNETFTYREAMYAMLTRNANEAAMGVAYTLSGGDLDGWVAQMNTLSQRIGTTASSWTDACGIDSGNTTCAVDMYLILRYLMSFDAFVEVSGAPSFTMPAKEKHRSSSVLVSQNAALSKASGGSYYRSAMQGGMCSVTAFKNDTGTQSYVSWGNKDGATYIFCVMDSPDSCDTFGYANRRPALFETVKLMDWVFDSFSIQAALDTDLTIAEIPVRVFLRHRHLAAVPQRQHDDPAALHQRRHRDPEILPPAGLRLRPHPAGRRGGHSRAEAGGRDHRRGGSDRRAGRSPQPAAVRGGQGEGVPDQPVPEGGAGAQPDRWPDLWAVAAVLQLEPPQAHQKDPPPLLSKAKAPHRTPPCSDRSGQRHKAPVRCGAFFCIAALQARFFKSSVRLRKVRPWLPVTVSAWSRLLRTLSSTHSATARNRGVMASSWSRVMGSRAFSE